MANLEDQVRFQKELPVDRTNIAPTWKLLETYSKIPVDEIDQHVISIRDEAFAIFHYPCIGRWRFLDLYITGAPEYPAIVSRLKSGESLLDVGTCFGHILRQFASDGVPSENLAGTDLRREFINLGYDLFRDKDTFKGQFVAGDIFNHADEGLASLDGKFDIVHSASFFHLFDWDDQVKVGERVVRFFKPGANALIVGRQVGTREPLSLEEAAKSERKRYLHNFTTLQLLWDTIGERTGTKWKVSGDLFDSDFDDVPRVIIRFAVSKVA